MPGFFLLSGFLFGSRETLTAEYVELRVCGIFKKLFSWIVFWSAVHYIRTGEMHDLWGNLTAGASAGGILPVSWFLFTYCLLILTGYPLWYFFKRNKQIFCLLSFMWAVILALGLVKNRISAGPQSLWIHLYMGYFCLGMSCHFIFEQIRNKIGNKYSIIMAAISSTIAFMVYAFTVKNAEVPLLPHNYYGKWYYSVWLVCMFWGLSLLRIKKDVTKTILKRMADNTFFSYLGHLPILVYVTSIKPLETTLMALVFIAVFFFGLNILAEIFRKLPLLRRLI